MALSIKGNRKYLYQWDIEQYIVISGIANLENYELIFQDVEEEKVYTVAVSSDEVKIPDAILTTEGTLNVLLYKDGAFTGEGRSISVIPRTKPEKYYIADTNGKLDSNMGAENAGKFLSIGEDGAIIAVELESGIDEDAVIALIEENAPDLSAYALASAIPDVSGFVNTATVSTMIETAISAIATAESGGGY